MTPEFTNKPLNKGWPFWVLELSPDASTAEIERAARDITNKINFNVPGIKLFDTPYGQSERDEFLVREAKNALQDPNQRILSEFWYLNPKDVKPAKREHNLSHREWLKTLGIN